MERSAASREGSTGQMGQTRPKLWIVGGPGVPTPELKARLSELFAIVLVPPGRLISSAPKTDVQLIIAPPEALPRPERSPGEEAIAGLLDAMGQGACVADADGHVVWSNLRFRNFDDATRGKIAAKCR